MRYRIEYIGGHCSDLARDRQELVRQIKAAAPGTIEDIRRLYKSGVSDSVMEKFEQYLNRKCPCQTGTLTKAGNPITTQRDTQAV